MGIYAILSFSFIEFFLPCTSKFVIFALFFKKEFLRTQQPQQQQQQQHRAMAIPALILVGSHRDPAVSNPRDSIPQNPRKLPFLSDVLRIERQLPVPIPSS